MHGHSLKTACQFLDFTLSNMLRAATFLAQASEGRFAYQNGDR